MKKRERKERERGKKKRERGKKKREEREASAHSRHCILSLPFTLSRAICLQADILSLTNPDS